MPSQPSTPPAAPSESAGIDRPDREQELRALSLALREGEGFRLILATYDVPSVRDSLIARLRVDLEKHGVRLTCLDASTRRVGFDLLEALQQHLAASVVPSNDRPRQAVAVVDLETCLDYQHKAPLGAGVLRRANLHREAFAERISCPVVFWLMPVATGLFAQEAPDLWHWRIATFDFAGAPTGRVEASELTRAGSFEEFRGLPLGRQHEGIAALRDRLLQLEHSVGDRPLSSREEAQRAALLDELGRAHAAMGHRDEALQATAEAVEIRRRLAVQRPDDFLPDLAKSLSHLGIMLGNLGRQEEALRATEEAVEFGRQLVPQHPDAFLPDLATHLNNLGIWLSKLGRRDDALQATEEAVEIGRRLAARRPDEFLPALAQSLSNVGVMLGNVGRRNEALQATEEAVEIRRRLAAQRPDEFLPDLAQSLDNLGSCLSDAGRREEALQATSEAAEILQSLASQRPDAFLPDLSSTLTNLGIWLSDLGRRKEALHATAQALEVRRRLAAQRPEAFLPDLAASLNSLGIILRTMGRWEAALHATAEAADIFRRLAAQRPEAFLPDLAMSLNNLGRDFSAAGHGAQALEASAESVRLTMPLVERYPQAFLDRLRGRLRSLRERCAELGQDPDADTLVRRATELVAKLDAAEIHTAGQRMRETKHTAYGS